MPGSLRIKLPPKDMMVSDFIEQWTALIRGYAYEAPSLLPITTHVQAAHEAQDMYPSADEAVVTLLDDGNYEVQLLREGQLHQTVTFGHLLDD